MLNNQDINVIFTEIMEKQPECYSELHAITAARRPGLK